MPTHELSLFKENIGYARDLASTAVALSAQVTDAINVDDLLRASIVQGVSAFDHFIHEEVRARMLQTQEGYHPVATAFEKFRVSLGSVKKAMTSSDPEWLEEEIRHQHGHLSFQMPDKVADALRLVTDVPLWKEISAHLNSKPESIKRQLKLIVDRRNKIAHEADTDPTPPRVRYRIDYEMTKGSLDFLENLGKCIVVAT